MKILYLHQYFNTPEMSGGTRSYEMARRLVSAGHEVHMITSWQRKARDQSWFETMEEGVHVHWLPVPYSNHMRYSDRIKAFFRFAMSAGKKASEIGGDVVFATSTPLTIAIPGVRVARKLKIPMVFEVRDLWPELPIAMGALRNPMAQWLAKRLEVWAYRNAAYVVALSPGMKEGVISTGYPSERVAVIPNSADLDKFFPEKLDAGILTEMVPELQSRKRVVYTGTFGAINGVGYMVDMAVASLAAGHMHAYVAIGDGAERADIERRARDSGVLGNNFWLLPPVKKSQMPDVLSNADVALSLFIDLKPMWANSANKFFDALASGTPVAINYGGWQADLLAVSGCGELLPAGSAVGGAAQLARLLADDEQLLLRGRAARALAEKKFSRDVLAQSLQGVLLDAAGQQ